MIYSVLPPPPVFLRPPVTNYRLLSSTLLFKKIARAPGGGGRKKYNLTKVGRRNRIDPYINIARVRLVGAINMHPIRYGKGQEGETCN